MYKVGSLLHNPNTQKKNSFLHWTQGHHIHKQISSLHCFRFSLSNCCLSVVLSLDKIPMLRLSSTKGLTPNVCMLCGVTVNKNSL